MMTKKNRLPILLTGIGIGAAAGLLLARCSGAKLRKEIRKNAEDAKDFIKEQTGVLADRVEVIADAVQDKLSDGLAKGTDAAQDFSNKAKGAMDTAARVAMKAADKASDKARAFVHSS